MSVQVKKNLADKLSIPYNWIKSKKPEQLLSIYRRCKTASLPFPSMRKFTFNGKIYLIPKTRLGQQLYGKVILTTRPLKGDVIKAATKYKIKMAKNITKDTLLSAITTKLIAIGTPEPILFHTIRSTVGKKKKVKLVNKITSPMPRNRLLVESIVRNNRPVTYPNRIKINKTTTVKYISNRANVPTKNTPPPQRRANIPTKTTPGTQNSKNTPPPQRRANIPTKNTPPPQRRTNIPTVPGITEPVRTPLPPRAPWQNQVPTVPGPTRTPLPPRVPRQNQVPPVSEPTRTPLPPRVPRQSQVPTVPESIPPVVPPQPNQQRDEPVAPAPSVKRNIKISNLMKRINQKRNIKINNLKKRIDE